MTKKKTEEPNGLEAIANHFGSDAEGFSNPNAEPQTEEAPLADVSPTSVEPTELTYSERLAELGISDEKATAIIDDMYEAGSYMASYVLRKPRKGKEAIKAAFLTRDSRTQGFIVKHVSKHHENIPMLYNKLLGELQLAGSIIAYGKEKFEPLIEIEDEEELERVYLNNRATCRFNNLK